MGTQQMLFVILSVIIIGVAVSVSIYAFDVQAMNSNRNAIIADMNYLAAFSIAYFSLFMFLRADMPSKICVLKVQQIPALIKKYGY